MIKLIEIKDLPQSCTGAPTPFVISNEHDVKVVYILANRNNDEDDMDEFAVITFDSFNQFKFGQPNDEVIDGHPFAKYGLSAYSFYEVENSPWIEELRIMNSVHHRHSDKLFEGLKHIIATFHDRTFEIVCEKYTFNIFKNCTFNKIVNISAQELLY